MKKLAYCKKCGRKLIDRDKQTKTSYNEETGETINFYSKVKACPVFKSSFLTIISGHSNDDYESYDKKTWRRVVPLSQM